MITIRRVTPADKPEWLRMRLALWPEGSPEEWSDDMDRMMADPATPVFVAVRANGTLGGFLEAGTRPYADGCDSSPVGYIEGWYVAPDLRRQGVGGQLVRAAEDWARSLGLSEMASDTWLDNETSLRAHTALGYEEAERLIHFAKKL
ncbi:MAG: aminoglycoside 6'-N-acetyltransferase [Chloroflexota bacterium]